MKNTLRPDPTLKDYWRNNSRFSDLFNQIIFEGEEYIKPDKLIDKDTDESAVIMEKGKATSISRMRDVIKQYDDGIELVLIGIENQTRVHYAMPVKVMIYDSLEYTHQCKELEEKNRAENTLKSSNELLSGIRKSDRIKPVITLVIYYGEKTWDGPIKLSDMMDIPQAFKKFYNDHTIHLLEIRNAGKYQFKNKDNHDFFTLIELFYNNKRKFDLESFMKEYTDLEIHWETLAAIGAVTGSMKLVNYAREHKGGQVNMCTALDNLMKEGIQKGIQEGIQKGRKEGIQALISVLKEFGIDDVSIIKKLKDKFQLDDQEAQKYLN